MEELDIFSYGWQKHENVLKPVWMTKAAIPDEIREVLNIYCKDKTCSTQKCDCFKENLKCSELCKCKECKNADTEPQYDSEDSDF